MVETLIEGCKCATSWCHLDLNFVLGIVSLTFIIFSRLYLENSKEVVGTLLRGCRCVISWCDLDLTFDLAVVTWWGHWLGCRCAKSFCDLDLTKIYGLLELIIIYLIVLFQLTAIL